jgi:RNA polymerase sigma-70 factor (ECF subfamily)
MQKQYYKNDAEVLKRMADGDMAAYRFLFDQHFSDLCNFLLIYLHSKELAEEIALEIFTYIWEKRKTLQIKVSFKSFLFSSAKNRAISLYRKEQKKLFTSIESEQSISPEDSDSLHFLENIELREIIDHAISKLPEKSKQIYLLAWEENLSHKEIAEQMGITPKTVENHVGIALRKLRESLSPYYRQIFMLWLTYILDN